MDIVLSPTGSAGVEWTLKDRLGRPIGKVEKSTSSGTFEILPNGGSKLVGIMHLHPTLDDVMTAIEKRMGGACQLDSQDWD
ncbi:hypothetical protein [Methylobacterium durans]|uniref:hypothetical protein n=1 Tax=Methylobacterium durans TaxID=2202825 RepID=UPI0013A56F9A|nr:hypothetical protein [Methylobacterium durans]